MRRLSCCVVPLLCCVLPVLFSGCMSTVPYSSGHDFGFLSSRDRDLKERNRFRAFGPVVERRAAPDSMAAFDAVRPFYNRFMTPDGTKSVHEILWPLGMIKNFEGNQYWQFFPAYGDSDAEGLRWRFAIFPLYFQGWDSVNGRYFALFPVGGRLNGFLWMDRVDFVLFPLYARSSVSDVVTTDILWPLISLAKGENVHRFRVFPFYGRSVRDGKWEKQFVMWPLWTSVKYNYPDERGGGFVLFPFWGHARLGDRQTWMFLPPFFRYSKGAEHSELNCPYPFLQIASGEYEKFYLWPVMGRKFSGGTKSWFFIWPVMTGSKTDRNESVLYRLQVFPLIISDINRRKADGMADRRYFKLWPLVSYRSGEGVSHLKVLDLWPLRDFDSIEKNLSPFWTLYSRHGSGDARESELLWGFYRSRIDSTTAYRSVFPLFSWKKSDGAEEGMEWNFLMGLFGYRRDGLHKSFRLLYFLRTGGDRPDASEPSSKDMGSVGK